MVFAPRDDRLPPFPQSWLTGQQSGKGGPTSCLSPRLQFIRRQQVQDPGMWCRMSDSLKTNVRHRVRRILDVFNAGASLYRKTMSNYSIGSALIIAVSNALI